MPRTPFLAEYGAMKPFLMISSMSTIYASLERETPQVSVNCSGTIFIYI